ncbi:MAG: hypothetical protein AAFO91_08295, partial [Bacteroidota bacterium]
LNIDGTCMSCIAKNTYAVNYKINGATANPYFKHVCAEQENDSMENFEFGFQYFDFADNTLKNYSTLPDDEMFWTTSTSADMLAASGSRVKHKCVNVFGGVFENCVEASIDGFQCTKCAEGYTFASNANDFNTCTKDVVSKSTCFKFFPGSVECEICAGDRKKDPSTGLCVLRTFTTGQYVPDSACAGNNADNTDCEICPDGNKQLPVTYYKKGSGVTAANCLQLNAAQTECIHCEPGYEYSGSGQDCTAAEADDLCSVLEYPYPGGIPVEFGNNNCLFCKPQYVLIGKQCALPVGAAFNTHLEIDLNGNYQIKGMSFVKEITAPPARNTVECAVPYGFLWNKWNTTISNCLIYARDRTCHLCSNRRTGDNCEIQLSSSPQLIRYDSSLEPTDEDMGGDNNNVNLMMQITLTDFVPVHCKRAKNITQIDMSGNFHKRSSFKPGNPRIPSIKPTSNLPGATPKSRAKPMFPRPPGLWQLTAVTMESLP